MTIKRLLQKAFVGGQWYVGYRRKGQAEYKIIETPKDMWIADPMLLSVRGEHYLFVEVYEKQKKKAAIGYYQFENSVPVFKGIIIENSYHMSYPCVFEHNGAYYMIPESSANSSISLYRAEHFPDKWVKETDLITGAKYVDSTVFKMGSGYGLLSYRVVRGGWELVKFTLDMEHMTLSEESAVTYQENIGRPAGYFFDGNKRPAQDCKNKYGENLLIYEVDSFQPYAEHLCESLSAKDFSTEGVFDRVHTYTEDDSYEVVDFFKERIDLLHGMLIIKRAYLARDINNWKGSLWEKSK